MAAPRKIDRARALKLHRQGMSAKDIAARMGHSPSGIQTALKAMGEKLVRKHRGRKPYVDYTQPDFVLARELYERGLTTGTIGFVVGWPPSTVAHRLKRMGVTLRKSSRTLAWEKRA